MIMYLNLSKMLAILQISPWFSNPRINPHPVCKGLINFDNISAVVKILGVNILLSLLVSGLL